MARLLGAFVVLTFISLIGCSPAHDSTSAGTAPTASARSPGDLADLLNAGVLSIMSTTGNGSSSGASVNGVIRNNSQRKVSVDIVMSRPVFFRNGGRGQNMIGSMIFKAGGGYVSDGTHSFVSLEPNEQTGVMFIAYCVDFDKDNPTSREQFTIDDAPPDLAEVMRRIAAYSRANPEADITVPAQVAVWLSQGIGARKIREKFAFTSSDEALARTFL